MLTKSQIHSFHEALWEYYHTSARDNLPWRQPEANGSLDLYKVLVSEIMLQQTQVSRVIPKFNEFLQIFPTVRQLAKAELGDVLKAWQGLGYNRRAKYLWLAARQVARDGWPDELTDLPGVGTNTAGAIRVYSRNEPAIFIETNVRTVYIYHFAGEETDVADARIRQWIEETIGRENPREFYWALMDYGTFLKTKVRNTSQSKHYRRQSAFEGSKRQLRGLVIRELSKMPLTLPELQICVKDDRLHEVLASLKAEGLITKHGKTYTLSP